MLFLQPLIAGRMLQCGKNQLAEASKEWKSFHLGTNAFRRCEGGEPLNPPNRNIKTAQHVRSCSAQFNTPKRQCFYDPMLERSC